MIDNIYERVLIASERAREINRQRMASGERGMSVEQYKQLTPIHIQVEQDIDSGRVGREYLKRIRDRAQRNKKFDHIN